MITEITKAQLLVWRLGNLANAGKVTPAQISMAKRTVRKLREMSINHIWDST